MRARLPGSEHSSIMRRYERGFFDATATEDGADLEEYRRTNWRSS